MLFEKKKKKEKIANKIGPWNFPNLTWNDVIS